MAKKTNALPPRLIEEAWRRGLLSYKLYDYQEPLYELLWDAIRDPKMAKYVLNCARRYGKTTILVLIALEYGLRNKEAQIRFAAPTAKNLRKIIHPIFKKLTKDAPAAYRPVWKSQEQMYVFPSTGSEIHLAGTDNGNYESLRGTASNLNIIDEAGFCEELDYILRSVLIPQTLTTDGTTLLASTPPKTPAHDFAEIAKECEHEGTYARFTIWQNKSLTQDQIEKAIKESGGRESTTFKREYECEFVVDEKSQIIPEWQDSYVQDFVKDEFYPYYHRYDAMDIGVKDFTALIFGFYDFKKATLYIEDEITINGPSMTTVNLKDQIIAKETDLWGSIKPYRRISDNNNLILIQDLNQLHGIHFTATNKDSLDAMVNELRILVASGRLIIHPRCKQLIGCIKYGVWTEKRNEFARSAIYGHFDHLAALIYLVRNLDKYSNPIPVTHNTTAFTHFVPEKKRTSESGQALLQLFNPKLGKR